MKKDFILNEIRRTAKANSGKPLGKRAFLSTTGIKESDWLGKYWVRWSEALAEAGLQANKFNDAYDQDFLCSKYVELIQELGHVPVRAEIIMKCRNDNTFPDYKTFSSRYGTKSELLNAVLQYCTERKDIADVASICESEVQKKHTAEVPTEPSNHQDGYVYLIQSGRHYKIGYTNDICRRGKEISVELPERANTIHVITTDDPSGIEAYWHHRFKSRRGNGEWFSLTQADIKAFRRRKFM